MTDGARAAVRVSRSILLWSSPYGTPPSPKPVVSACRNRGRELPPRLRVDDDGRLRGERHAVPGRLGPDWRPDQGQSALRELRLLRLPRLEPRRRHRAQAQPDPEPRQHQEPARLELPDP